MYDICEKVWVIIDIFDTPKECTVLDYKKENGIMLSKIKIDIK